MNQQSHLTLFPPISPTGFIAIVTFRSLSRTENGKQSVVIILERYSKLSRAILTTKTSISFVATILFEKWINECRTPSFLLTNHDPQFVAKMFKILWHDIKFKLLTTTAYQSQTKRQVERDNNTLLTWLRHSTSDHQKRLGQVCPITDSRVQYAGL